MGITVHHEPIAKGDHQQNGAVESTLQQVRLKAGILVSQIEKTVGGEQLSFPATHPVFNWALLHAAWLSNRYIVKQGTTAYERPSDRMYTGKLCMFGETVLGYLKGDCKAVPRWTKGIWLGKALTNDTHIIAHGTGVFVTRSVRRLPTPFVLEDLGDLRFSPWEFGYAAVGHRMVYNKHLSPPIPVGMPMIDVEAVQVKKYAQENPNEDLEPELSAQAGQADNSDVQPMVADASAPEGHKRPEPDDPQVLGEAKKLRIGDEQPVTPHDDSMVDAGERAPKTPKLSDSPKQQHMMQVTSTDLELYEHEDSAVRLDFSEDDLDRLEQYDIEFYHDEWLAVEDQQCNDDEMALILKELTFPFSAREPDVPPDELTRFDALADKLELHRLEKLKVLQDSSTVSC